MDRPSWQFALQWALWGVAMTLVMGWISRSRLRCRQSEGPQSLSQPLPTLIIGVVCTGFFLAIAIISNVTSNPTATWLTTSIFIGFALLGVPMISLYFTD